MKALYWSEYQKRYVSAPSYSPENGPIVNGASYDRQFIWQHFENTIQGGRDIRRWMQDPGSRVERKTVQT